MTKAIERTSIFAVFAALGWPMIAGLSACTGFYMLVLRGPLSSPAFHRYFAAHPVSYAATAMFFVGMAALLFKLLNVLGQYGSLGRIRLDPIPSGGQPPQASGEMLDELEKLPARVRDSYLGRRLMDAVN